MRLSFLNEKIVGKKLEMPIYSSEGTVILNSGIVLSERAVSKLKELGVGTVYINDIDYEDVVVQEVIDTKLRIKILKELKKLFEDVEKKKKLDSNTVKAIVKDILDNSDMSENATISLNNIETNNEDICRHSLDVTILSILVGMSRQYNYGQIFDLAVGALLHDVGKFIAEGKAHAEQGFSFVRSYREFSAASNICVYSHHENVNGTGYPKGFKGDQIYEYAKIVALCNEYDNLLKSKEGKLPHEVLAHIGQDVGKRFDEDVYKDFIKVVRCYQNGLPVTLNNGKNGVVVMQNKNLPQRPIVKLYDNGEKKYINLMEKLSIFIYKVNMKA